MPYLGEKAMAKVPRGEFQKKIAQHLIASVDVEYIPLVVHETVAFSPTLWYQHTAWHHHTAAEHGSSGLAVNLHDASYLPNILFSTAPGVIYC